MLLALRFLLRGKSVGCYWLVSQENEFMLLFLDVMVLQNFLVLIGELLVSVEVPAGACINQHRDGIGFTSSACALNSQVKIHECL